MKYKTSYLSAASFLLAFGAVEHASAVVTYAEATANLAGEIPIMNTVTAGAEGAQTSADLVVSGILGDVFLTAQALSRPGALLVAGVARSTVPNTNAYAATQAVWADSFPITAGGFDSTRTGTFSAAVDIGGELRADITGLGIGGANVIGSFYIDAGEGNVGRVQDRADLTNSFELGEISSGNERFVLHFDDVPFRFGREITVELRLQTASHVRVFGGGSAYSEADYSHTMTWMGLSDVRDSSGNLLSDYSALSVSSGFDFSPVPAPSAGALMLAGLLGIGRMARRSTTVAPRSMYRTCS